MSAFFGNLKASLTDALKGGDEPPQPPSTKRVSSNDPPQRAKLTPEQRVQKYTALTAKDTIPMDKVRIAARQGVPETPGNTLRATYWKLLLGYLPPDRSQWDSVLAAQRKLYLDFKAELMVNPRSDEAAPEMETTDISGDDHPLNLNPDSVWDTYFKNEEIWGEIKKDVDRTLPDYNFFSVEDQAGLQRHDALLRILFVYAKLNPGIKYVQGMNEVLAPIYYLFANGEAHLDQPHGMEAVEADAFFCFTNIMAELRDHFCKTLDHHDVGIMGRITVLSKLLKQKDPELWKHLERERVSPTFYAFRWITLLLTQEFDLPDVLRLWDSLLGDTHRFLFLLYFCCAMLICARDLLLHKDFAGCVKTLQRYPLREMQLLLAKAIELYKEDERREGANLKTAILEM